MTSGSEFEKDYIIRLLLNKNEMAVEDCLTDNWITSERTFFLDLTAGPFEWGPLIGSEGVS